MTEKEALTTDLVSRLTSAAHPEDASDFYPKVHFKLLLDARDEIERVRENRNDLLTLCREMRDWLRPEVTKEPDRSYFWKLVTIIQTIENEEKIYSDYPRRLRAPSFTTTVMRMVDSNTKEALSEEERITANAKALGDICAYPWNEQGMPGITLRQLYAAMAMKGFATLKERGDHLLSPEGAAKTSVQWADALLKELAK